MTRKRGARRLAREWWPEIALTVFFGFIFASFFAAPDKRATAFAIGWTMICIALGWWLGHRHRRLPMQATLDGVRQDVSEVREIITTAVGGMERQAEPRKGLRVVR